MTIIAGTVVKGKQLGRKLGFPTANVDAKIHGLRNGVYGVLATVNHQFHLGVMNIGVKPTVGSNLEKTLEIFCLTFIETFMEKKSNAAFSLKLEKKEGLILWSL